MAVSLQEKQQALSDLPPTFPKLQLTLDDVTSSRTPDYNCIAYAAKDETKWWWPTPFWLTAMYRLPHHHWPQGLPREHPPTVENFLRAFEGEGYRRCKSGEHEYGYEKVALYVDVNRTPTHMARELGDGVWHSKLGEEQDIRHYVLDAVENQVYGKPSYYMRKRIPGISRWQILKGYVTNILRGSK
jgi:hypothetical protein